MKHQVNVNKLYAQMEARTLDGLIRASKRQAEKRRSSRATGSTSYKVPSMRQPAPSSR
jgi:hypothetical protein